MTIGSILLGIALLVVVGLFVARPFLSPTASAKVGDADLSRPEALTIQKEAVLVKIRELDFDHETGKVPDAKYAALREQYLAEAAEILKALDASGATSQPAGRAKTKDDMEAAIARLRQKPAGAPTPAPVADDIEAAVARLRQQKAPAAVNGKPATVVTATAQRTGFCPQCGEARGHEDNFCAACGHAFA